LRNANSLLATSGYNLLKAYYRILKRSLQQRTTGMHSVSRNHTKRVLTSLQVRSSAHSCQRTPRGRKSRIHARSWLTFRPRCFLCLWRRCRLKDRQAPPRRRRTRARRTSPTCHWQFTETGGRCRQQQAEADKLVLQQWSLSWVDVSMIYLYHFFRGSGRIQQHNVSAFSFASDRCKVSFPFLIRLMR
jgi:hypothetical protein